MTIELLHNLLGFIAPPEVINNFELVSFKEQSNCIILKFEELAKLVPSDLEGKKFKLCGFANKIELHTFPQKGKSCYLHINRRKWEDLETGEIYSNHYDLHKKGMKATDDFGAFLKKNNRFRAG